MKKREVGRWMRREKESQERGAGERGGAVTQRSGPHKNKNRKNGSFPRSGSIPQLATHTHIPKKYVS